MSFYIKSSGTADVSVPDEAVFSRVRHLTNFQSPPILVAYVHDVGLPLPGHLAI